MIIQSAILNISETFHIHKMIRVQIFHKSSGWQTDKPDFVLASLRTKHIN